MEKPAAAEQLARFVVDLTLDGLPPAIAERAHLCLLDGLAAMVAGSGTPTASLARDLLTTFGGSPQASVVGSALRTSAPWAALANGMQTHALELDDGHRFAIGLHNAATTLPAALAVAEWRGASGSELLAAIVAGYEVAGWIGSAINPAHRYLSFHSTGTVGCFGAAAASAKLLGLDAERTARALGIAGSLAGGLFEFLVDGSTVKHLHGGAAAMHGVMAALLAERGMTGPKSILEGREGFLAAFVREPIDLTGNLEQLGKRWELDRVYFKLHSACAHCFSPIDAALALRSELGGADVARGSVRTYHAAAVLDRRTVCTAQEARFSIPYCVAVALLLGHASTRAFEPAALADPAIARLAGQIDVIDDMEYNAQFPQTRAAELRLELSDGRVLQREVLVPRGMPENPPAPQELELKARALIEPVLGRDVTARLIALVKLVERRSTGELMACLTP